MSRTDAVQAMQVGLDLATEAAREGIRLIGTGEMGIGNTTPSAAITAVMTGRSVADVTGRGTGIGKPVAPIRFRSFGRPWIDIVQTAPMRSTSWRKWAVGDRRLGRTDPGCGRGTSAGGVGRVHCRRSRVDRRGDTATLLRLPDRLASIGRTGHQAILDHLGLKGAPGSRLAAWVKGRGLSWHRVGAGIDQDSH